MNKFSYCTIYIVRHGETDWNASHRVQGQTDVQLNPVGEQQARATGNELSKIDFSAVYSSDLLRAKKTAEIITLERKMEVKTSELLREQYFGKFEGKPREEFLSLFTEWEKLSEEERFHHTVGDEESPHQAVSRLLTFLREVSIIHQGQSILVVAHGGLMRYLLISLGEAKFVPAVFFKNTGYLKLRSDGIEFFVDEISGIEQPR